MKTNVSIKYTVSTTHGGSRAARTTYLQALRRSVLSCMLWEGEYYEDGVEIAQRIWDLSGKVTLQQLADLAVEARTVHNLRHVPLILLMCLIRRGRGDGIVSKTIVQVIQRADELAELLALYWKDGKRPLAKQLKKGLALAFKKFSAYQLAKYNRDGAVKLRDVMFMVHPKPDGAKARYTKHERAKEAAGLKDYQYVLNEQETTYRELVNGTLAAPDTWEVELSAGKDKKKVFTRLLKEGKLGYLALLRNLRNMAQAGVDEKLVRDAITARKGAERVLPFRYVAAARAAPRFERELDLALSEAIVEMPPLSGTTAVLVDVSGSMNTPLSGKSDLTRMDAAATLASMIPGQVRLFSFSDKLKEIPPRHGMAGVDAIIKSQPHSSTALANAVAWVNAKLPRIDRLIVITDEQATDGAVPAPRAERAYRINVASNKNGLGYGKWTHLDGFSESVLKWIAAFEAE